MIIVIVCFLLSMMLLGASIAYADTIYIVQPGDTLWSIARLHGVTLETLIDANHITDPSRIYAGQRLTIPGGAAPPRAKGLAMAQPQYAADLAALDVSWWYVWGWCDAPDCVPMVRSMQLPMTCGRMLLVGNEPNAIEPWGHAVVPTDAVIAVKQIQLACPFTRLIVGNVSADDWSVRGGYGNGARWLKEFLALYPGYDGALGVHCYSAKAATCIKQLRAMRRLYGGEMWVTEYAITTGDLSEFSALTDYIARAFDRYAAYTNRQPHTGEGWEIDSAVEMVRDDGGLTLLGQEYASR